MRDGLRKGNGQLKRKGYKAADERDLLSSLLLLRSKSFLASAVTFLGASGIWLMQAGRESLLSGLKPYAPAAMSLAGSFAAGFLVGWYIRRTFGKTIMVTGGVIALVFLLVKFGVGGAGFEAWVNASAGWVSDSKDQVQRYLAVLLPSAAAAGTGFYKGCRQG
jgi:uncharacterized membrane protein (Fun14 family)